MTPNPLADILERQTTKTGRKLSFDAQCSWFICLRLGVAPIVIARASGLALPTVCYLRMAGEHRSGQLRYPKVAHEYAALGHEAFVHKYLTPLIREQVEVAVEQVRQAESARAFDETLNDQGYSPRATRYCGRHEWPATSIGMHAIFRIELCPGRGGYMWRNLKPFYDQPEIAADQISYHPATQLAGDPSRGPEYGLEAKGFATSEACYRHLKKLFDPKESR